MDTKYPYISAFHGWFLVLVTLLGPMSEVLADLIRISVRGMVLVATPASSLLTTGSLSLDHTLRSWFLCTSTLNKANRGSSV